MYCPVYPAKNQGFKWLPITVHVLGQQHLMQSGFLSNTLCITKVIFGAKELIK